MLNQTQVSIIHEPRATYALEPPFHPAEAYPEYRFGKLSERPNFGYAMVREFLHVHGFDRSNFGTPRWNPLREFIRPGDTVLIKPNLVMHKHGHGHDLLSVVTHGSVIRAILDYVSMALEGTETIVVGDAPLQSCEFSAVSQKNGLDDIKDFYKTKGLPVDIVDFRLVTAATLGGMIVRKAEAAGDPRGHTVVDWGRDSLLAPTSPGFERYRVTNYDPIAMPKHHNTEKNEYIVTSSLLQADVVINLPKMKTHRKVGITAALKNLVGINAHKDCLPHHRTGSIEQGGDEYENPSSIKELLVHFNEKQDVTTSVMQKTVLGGIRRGLGVAAKLTAKDRYFEGSWYGNDTLWRTVLDLNRTLFYVDRNGRIQDTVQRRLLNLVDGIVAGEGNGPTHPTPKSCGLLVGGFNPVAVDTVIARLMGFDYRKIPVIREAFGAFSHPLADFEPEDVAVASNSDRLTDETLRDGSQSFAFVPPDGWLGHIER
jgi:uncharacterized protein (DUF362 family)